MANLDVLEVRIIEHCNYRCISCGAFSNIAKKEEYGLENYRRDLKRLTEVFDGINTFRIYGGEPLIAENLYSYMISAREILRDSKIELVTNGFLLHKMDDHFFELLEECSIKVVISYYGGNIEKVDKGIEELEKRNLDLEIIPIRHFYIMQDFTSKNNPTLSREMCVVSIASYLHGGRLYACPYPFSYRHYDKRFGTNYSCIEDGIDIYEKGINAEKVLNHLSKPMSFCENCGDRPRYVEWKQGKVTENDWFTTENNCHMLKDYSWYDFLLEVDKLFYNTVHVDIYKNSAIYKCVNEDNLNNQNKYYVWIDDEYSKLIFDRTFIKTAKNKNICYEIIGGSSFKDKSNLKSEIRRIIDNEYVIILFTSETKNKIKLIKEINRVILKNS